MKKKGMAIRPFRILAVALSAFACIEIARLPEHKKSLENLQEALESTQSRFLELQTENRELEDMIAACQSDEAIERLVRREHGYGWYGETIYEVENLEEIESYLAAEDLGEN